MKFNKHAPASGPLQLLFPLNTLLSIFISFGSQLNCHLMTALYETALAVPSPSTPYSFYSVLFFFSLQLSLSNILYIDEFHCFLVSLFFLLECKLYGGKDFFFYSVLHPDCLGQSSTNTCQMNEYSV